MKKILFQGDSVTDAGRDRENPSDVGTGYVNLIAAELGYTVPQQFVIENRGIAGDRSLDMLARWNNDCLKLAPDYLSILIGVNDVWHGIACNNGISADRYEVFLRMMLDDVSKQLPNTNVIIMEPFITHGTSTDRAWKCFRGEIDKRIETVRRLAAEYGIGCVRLQEEFERAEDVAPAENWTLEGVHPTPAGSTVIKNAWLKLFNNGNF